MNIPEVEVRSFKQQGGESLKDAWSGCVVLGAVAVSLEPSLVHLK